IWAGIHYQMDNLAGQQLGKSVAQLFISWAEAASPTTRTPTLTVDAASYCVGASWILKLSNARPVAPIRLVGTFNGKLWDAPQWRITDATGGSSVTGTFTPGTEGNYVLTVEVDGLFSNSVSYVVSNCTP